MTSYREQPLLGSTVPGVDVTRGEGTADRQHSPVAAPGHMLIILVDDGSVFDGASRVPRCNSIIIGF